MTRRMLIDGTHREETRVVITDGNRLDEYDIETSTKTQLKGNIYLAKVTRVEPSLQAAFVDYGGGRHGFLAFSEIHPDYYQIPIEDREALKRDLAEMELTSEAAHAHAESIDGDVTEGEEIDHSGADDGEDEHGAASQGESNGTDPSSAFDAAAGSGDNGAEPADLSDNADDTDEGAAAAAETPEENNAANCLEPDTSPAPRKGAQAERSRGGRKTSERRSNPMRRYKIQEVIKRRQILLVQVVKEERGNKGAALTTYLSLAGRYCVLMPNVTRSGGGISRKITNASDRRRLRELLKDLNVPEGMGVIMRTAGIERNKSEIRRDFDYLMRLWEDVRTLTLESAAPALVYEEGNLIKRAIRDLYTRDIEEVLVEGNEAYQAAKKLMRMMMPSHAKRVQPYRDSIPLFHRYQVEAQLESMHNPVVQLKSGGYLVIDTTEALVAIDVNSGRSTKERNIEETAVKTNLEAASEIARQLRLRDLAGLIVIDFIDMDEARNQRAVEKRFKEAVKTDRARIQLGRISPFGLFELSRQRLRPSLIETSTEACPHCHGSGFIRSTESTALHALRMIEEEGIRQRSSELSVSVPTSVALYILNQKRSSLIEIEARYGMRVTVSGDDSLIPPDMRIDRIKAKSADRARDEAQVERAREEAPAEIPIEDEVEEIEAEEGEQKPKEPGRKRRPRRRRRKDGAAPEIRSHEAAAENSALAAEEHHEDADLEAAEGGPADGSTASEEAGNGVGEEHTTRRPRRRGRRGGRRRGQKGEQHANQPAEQHTEGGEDLDAAPADAPSVEPDPYQGELPGSTGIGEQATETERDQPFAANGNGAVTEVADESAKGAAEPQAADPEEPAPAQPAEPSEPVVPDAEPQPPREPRRGWWQRMIE